MTPERFEEIVKIGVKAVLGPNFNSENSPYLQSIAEKNTLATLTAIYPLIRDEVIEECAKIAKEAWMVPPDGGCPTDGEVEVCDEASRRILTLKTKEPT